MDVKIDVNNLSVSYGGRKALKDVTIDVYQNMITGFMGPASSGKSTLISVFNRMIDFEDGVRIEGKVYIDGIDIINGKIDRVALRRRVGTLFAVPIPLPRSIYDNIAYGPRLKAFMAKIN
jgi:phosphate transport system ATP-binding protein